MAILDVFDSNAFTTVEMMKGIDRKEWQPSGLSSFFTHKGIRGLDFSIETRGTQLKLIQTSNRGAPLDQTTRGLRNMRKFSTSRIGVGDRITASELDFVRQFDSADAVQSVAQELSDRMGGNGRHGLINNVDLTFEHMYLGALQGKFVDADGSVLVDWASELGDTASPTGGSYTIPTEIFDFSALNNGLLREKLTKLSRTIARASEGAWNPRVKFVALCGDDFFDEMMKNTEIRETYRYVVGDSMQPPVKNSIENLFGDAYGVVNYRGLTVINYKGTDDNSTVSIADDEAHLFPINIPDNFVHVSSHGESFKDLGKVGSKYYPLITRDRDHDRWVDLELLSYPAMLVRYPRLLRKLKLA
jgi:hypothetical protein